MFMALQEIKGIDVHGTIGNSKLTSPSSDQTADLTHVDQS